MSIHSVRALVPGWLLLLAIAGCTPLAPENQVPELSSGVSNDLVWQPLSVRPAQDEHVLLNRGMNALDVRLRAIDSAASSIDLQTFLWSPDTAGVAVTRHLLAAAERGVRVRILIDDTYLTGRDRSLLQFAEHERIAFRVYNPHKQRGVDFVSAEALNLLELQRLDHRMHNKAMIVDGQIAIAGGRNLADEYFGLHPEGNFRDVEVLLRGPVIGELSTAFDDYWNDPWSIPLEKIADSSINTLEQQVDPLTLHKEHSASRLAQHWGSLFERGSRGGATVVADRPPEKNPALESEAPIQVADFIVELLDGASEEVIILSAYLIPTAELELAVARARQRNVRVRILTNSLRSNNHLSAHSAYRNHIETLVDMGVELYEVRADASERDLYMQEPIAQKELAIHAKVLLIDHDLVFLGSANLDPRSLKINTELGLLIESAPLNAQLRQATAVDFSAGNAWNVARNEEGHLMWRSGEILLKEPPSDSFMQRIEDWLLSTLPLESEL